MTHRFSMPTFIAMLLIFASCNAQEVEKEVVQTAQEVQDAKTSTNTEPHQYGGWYCPDNFGFVPVDIQKLHEVPAIANRLPTEEELKANKSLIAVDAEKYPDARALKMELPRVASIFDGQKGIDELIIVIQAIVIQEDTIVGYRFPNGGNGSAWMSDVTFLSENEVAGMGAQPFFYSKSVVNASAGDIWNAASKTEYFKQLGDKFNQKKFFTSKWNPESDARLDFAGKGEEANGYVGMVFGNYYLHIDYIRDGFHYSEKLLMVENQEDKTTEFFFASGPYPKDFEKQQSKLESWVKAIKKSSEAK